MRFILFLSLLLFPLLTFGAEKLYLIYGEETEMRYKRIENYFHENYESDHLVRMANFRKKLRRCNPPRRDDEQAGAVNFCLDKSYFALWAGIGSFYMKSADQEHHERSLSATSYFLGGQFMYSLSLSTLLIAEGKYFYLPSFSDNHASTSENLKTASYSTLALFLQRRFSETSWSARFGGLLTHLPGTANATGAELLANVQLKKEAMEYMGPLLGVKFSPDRNDGGVFSTYFDYIPVLRQDGENVGEIGKYFHLRLGVQWFFHRFWAMTGEAEAFKVSNKVKDDVSGRALTLGVKFYLF